MSNEPIDLMRHWQNEFETAITAVQALPGLDETAREQLQRRASAAAEELDGLASDPFTGLLMAQEFLRTLHAGVDEAEALCEPHLAIDEPRPENPTESEMLTIRRQAQAADSIARMKTVLVAGHGDLEFVRLREENPSR